MDGPFEETSFMDGPLSQRTFIFKINENLFVDFEIIEFFYSILLEQAWLILFA